MKAPVGLLSDRTVLRSKMEGLCPDKFQFVGLRCRGGYNGSIGFPLWGKLSPQVTDEGEPSGHFSLIRRVPRHLPPKGKAFPGGVGLI